MKTSDQSFSTAKYIPLCVFKSVSIFRRKQTVNKLQDLKLTDRIKIGSLSSNLMSNVKNRLIRQLKADLNLRL